MTQRSNRSTPFEPARRRAEELVECGTPRQRQPAVEGVGMPAGLQEIQRTEVRRPGSPRIARRRRNPARPQPLARSRPDQQTKPGNAERHQDDLDPGLASRDDIQAGVRTLPPGGQTQSRSPLSSRPTRCPAATRTRWPPERPSGSGRPRYGSDQRQPPRWAGVRVAWSGDRSPPSDLGGQSARTSQRGDIGQQRRRHHDHRHGQMDQECQAHQGRV